MAVHVTFEVTDSRASRRGDVVTVVGDEVQADPMTQGKLQVLENGSVKTTFEAEALKSVVAAEDPGNDGVGLGGML